MFNNISFVIKNIFLSLLFIILFCSISFASDAVSFRYPFDFTEQDGRKMYKSKIDSKETWEEKEWYNAQNFGSLYLGKPHAGEDWNWGSGRDDYEEPIFSIANGIVHEVWIPTEVPDPGKWGKCILLKHSAPSGKEFITGTGYMTDTVYSFYSHLKEIKILDDDGNEIPITKGQTKVSKGWQIGKIGDADGLYSPHLHFEIRLTDDQNIITNGGKGTGYTWDLKGYTHPTEFIENNTSLDLRRPITITVHPYEDDRASMDGTEYFSKTGSWTREGVGIDPDLGYCGYIWYKKADSEGFAKWTPKIPFSGYYRVYVHIPRRKATAEVTYHIKHGDSETFSQDINQSLYYDEWVQLIDPVTGNDVFYFQKGSENNYVSLDSNLSIDSIVAADAVKFVYDPFSIFNIDAALIIDSSGSMSWNDPTGMRKEAAKIFVDVAQNEDQVAIIDFDSYAQVFWKLQPLTEDRDGIKAAIDRIDSSGGTNIGRGLLAGYYELLSSSEPNSKAAVLLTDGEGSYYNEAELFKNEGWPIYTVGLGSSVDANLLNKIANDTGGKYFALNDASQLKNVYFEIATNITGGTSLFGETLYMLTGDYYEMLVNVPLYQQVITFLISWPGSEVSTTLTTPSGRQIAPDNEDSDVYHAKGLTYELYRINSPEAGEWTVGLTGIDLDPYGEEVNVSLSGIGSVIPPDTTPPVINISSPVNGKTYFDQLPTRFNFTIEDPESAIISQTALLNGIPIKNNESVLLTQLGENTLTISATNEVGLTSEKTITFFVNYFTWLPPIWYKAGSETETETCVVTPRSTLPIKFAIFDEFGSFVSDTSVKVVVEGTTAEFTYGNRDISIRINQEEGEDPNYIVNLRTNFKKWDYQMEVDGEYWITVYFDNILAAKTKLKLQ